MEKINDKAYDLDNDGNSCFIASRDILDKDWDNKYDDKWNNSD